MYRLSAIQMCSGPDVAENLRAIDCQLASLPSANHHLVVLPEACLLFGCKDRQQLAMAKHKNVSEMQSALQELASKYGVFLVAGTIPLLTEDSQKITASSLLISPHGELLAEYQKMHLFDVVVDDNEKNYQESKYTQAGSAPVIHNTPLGQIGMTVCYDLRFPELFRALTRKGADIITVPSAFTRVTGKAHWQALLQARAIENQVYIVASGQEGVHQNGRETWGHSMIINPWGEIVEQRNTGEGAISCLMDRELIERVRNSIPVAEHNKFTVELS